MPLSDHEQRAWQQMTESLAEDPKFASAVRSNDPRVRARRRLLIAAIVIIAGLGLVVFGTIEGPLPVGLAGFAVMLGGAALAMSRSRGGGPPLPPGVSDISNHPTRRRSSLIDRLEERWRRRPEGNR